MKKTIISILLGSILWADAAYAKPELDFTLLIGGPGKELPGSGVNNLRIGTGFPVSAKARIDDETGAFVLKIAVEDVLHFQPDKLQYFDQQAQQLTITYPWRAPVKIAVALEAEKPVVVSPGIYPFTIDKYGNYVIVIPQP